jgi:hypothetical protein
MEDGDRGMNVREQIDRYIDDQPPVKREELRDLHRRMLAISPDAELWFLDGRNDDGKVVSNPNIGYGSETLSYATGTSRAFYKIGLSANRSGFSVYVMGLKDKTYLSQTYGSRPTPWPATAFWSPTTSANSRASKVSGLKTGCVSPARRCTAGRGSCLRRPGRSRPGSGRGFPGDEVGLHAAAWARACGRRRRSALRWRRRP